MKYGRTFLATVTVLLVVFSALSKFSPAISYAYADRIDENLQLEEGKTYVVVVRLKSNPNLEPIRFNRDAVVNELKREATVTQEPIITYLEKKGVKILSTSWLVSEILIEADANTIWELAALPTVAKIFRNFELIPPASELGTNTEFIVSGNSTSWNLKKVRAPEVWEELGVRGENIRVATADGDGIDISHPEIAGTLWTEDSSDPKYPGGWIEFDHFGHRVEGSVPHYTGGHGTAVYGLILGQTMGMAPNAIGMHAKIVYTYQSAVVAMEWMIEPYYYFDQKKVYTEKPADVSCHSYGLSEGNKDYFIDVIRRMWDFNHFVVASVGNSGEGTSEPPGMVYECIAVGATDANDNVWEYSSGRIINKTEWGYFKLPDWPDQWVKPDLSAPGLNVEYPLPGNTYDQGNGTSLAAPHVAGAAVLMLSRNPSLPVQDIEDILKETAVWYPRYSPERPDTRYGWGRIDAYRAVLLAGFKVTLVIPTGNVNGTYEIATAVKEELVKVRVHVEVEERTASEIADTIWGDYWNKTWEEEPYKGWDMVWYEFSGTLEDLTSYYLANATPPNGGYNIMPWMNPKADEPLLEGMNTSHPTEKRKESLGTWQKLFMDDVPAIIIYYPNTPICARGIAFNLHHPALSNRYVRQAIARTIPYVKILSEILPK